MLPDDAMAGDPRSAAPAAGSLMTDRQMHGAASPPSRPHSISGAPPWAALLTGLVLRLAWGAVVPGTPLRGDEETYVALARSLAAGHGYVAFGVPFTHYLPGWPLTLAVPLVLGFDLTGARVMQCLISTTVCFWAFLLGSRLVSRRVGVTAAWVGAFFPPLIWFSHLLTSETVSAALVGGWAVLGAKYVGDGGGWQRASGLAVLGALLPLFRAELVVVAPLPFLVRALEAAPRRELVRAAGACLAVAVALLPWWLYNERRFGEFIPLSTAGGVGLWIASHDPPLTDFDTPEFLAAATRLTIPGRPKNTDAAYAAEARDRIRQDPILYLSGRLLNLPRFWLGSHSETVPGAEPPLRIALKQGRYWAVAVKMTGFASQALLVAAALVGAVISFRRGVPLLLCLTVAMKFAAHAPFVQTPRFSLHLAPVLFAYAAAAAAFGVDRARRGKGPTPVTGTQGAALSNR